MAERSSLSFAYSRFTRKAGETLYGEYHGKSFAYGSCPKNGFLVEEKI